MGLYRIFFILMFIWSGIYTVSVCRENFRCKDYIPGVNAAILLLCSALLCVAYTLM